MIEIRGYVDRDGRQPYAHWFMELDIHAAARVTTALTRNELGNFASVKGVGAGVFEYKLDSEPGYRIYFGKDGDRLVILVGGGTKKRQPKDIEVARERWADYKKRKKEERDDAVES